MHIRHINPIVMYKLLRVKHGMKEARQLMAERLGITPSSVGVYCSPKGVNKSRDGISKHYALWWLSENPDKTYTDYIEQAHGEEYES